MNKSGGDEKFNFFDILKNNIISAYIPDAYRMFLFFANKSDMEWDEKGNIKINGDKIQLDMFKLFKYLTSKNMKIEGEDKYELKRIVYTAYPIKEFIKNRHIIHMMDYDDDDNDDNIQRNLPQILSPPETRSNWKKRKHNEWEHW